MSDRLTPLGRHQQGSEFARFSSAADRDLANADTSAGRKPQEAPSIPRCSRATRYTDAADDVLLSIADRVAAATLRKLEGERSAVVLA